MTKWLDSSLVNLGSNFVGVAPHDMCQKWDKNKQNLKVPRQKIVSVYYNEMREVDKCDFFYLHLQIVYKIKKVWLNAHALDMAVVKLWLEYRRITEILGCTTKLG